MTPVNATFTIADRVYHIDALAGISFTRGLGMTPAHNQFDLAYSDGMTLPAIGESGTLVLRDGMSPEGVVAFIDQIVDDVDWGSNPSGGRTVRVVVKDTRERSTRGSITGTYNVPKKGIAFETGEEPAEGILTGAIHKRHLRELVSLCFDALGVTYDVSIVPVDQYPAVKWEFDNPASEIDRLLSEYGYAVSLASNNVFVVVRLGERDARHGPFVSDVPNEEESQRFTSTGLSPDTIVKGDRIVIEEETFGLIPVGLDIDGIVKPLGQLSYFAPRLAPGTTEWLEFGGFQFILDPDDPQAYKVNDNIIIPEIADEPAPKTKRRVIDAARASIWKWYALPDEHLYKLPILGKIATTKTDIITGKTARREPIVLADAYVEEHTDPDTDQRVYAGNSGDIEVDDGYSIDLVNGVVKFAKPMSKRITGAFLVTAAYVRLTWAWKSVRLVDRDANDQPLPALQWLPQIAAEDFYYYPGDATLQNCKKLEHRELILYRRREYDEDGNPIDTDLNREELDAYSEKLIQKHLWSSQPVVEAASATVPRILDYECDGFVRQLTWNVSGRGGASTSAYANRETGDTPDAIYEERLKSQRVNTILRNEDRFGFEDADPALQTIVRPPADHPESRPGGVPIINRLDEDIPAFSFIEIDKSDSEDSTKSIRIKRPIPNDSADSRGMLVALKPVPKNGGTARAAHDGFVFVRCTEETAVGDRIGPSTDDPYVGAPGMGVYCVLGKPADDLALIQLNTPGIAPGLTLIVVTRAFDDGGTPPLRNLFYASIMTWDDDAQAYSVADEEIVVQSQNGAAVFDGARIYVQPLALTSLPGREDAVQLYAPVSGEPFGFLAKVWQTEEDSDEYHFEQTDAGIGLDPLDDIELGLGTAYDNAAESYEVPETGDPIARNDYPPDPADEEEPDGLTITCSLPGGATLAQVTITGRLLTLAIIDGSSPATVYIDLDGKTLGEVETEVDAVTGWSASVVGDSAADAGMLQQLYKEEPEVTAYVDHRIPALVRWDSTNQRFFVQLGREPKTEESACTN